MLRRKPSGETWSELQIVVQDQPASLNNPCALATKEGRIWLMYQRYPEGVSEWNSQSGYDPTRTCGSFIVYSDDDGVSWSQPRDITQEVRAEAVQTVASGPGVGIEVTRGSHQGRLVFPFNERRERSWTSFAVYSDDDGHTWTRGQPAPKADGTQPNETQVAELSDGSLLLNARNQASEKVRLQATSVDGGRTWSTASPIATLVDPVCMGSIVRVSFEPSVLAFSNPSSPTARERGLVRFSFDEGQTWPVSSPPLTTGSFGYSCLVALNDQKVGVLYESVEPTPTGEGYRILYRELTATRN